MDSRWVLLHSSLSTGEYAVSGSQITRYKVEAFEKCPEGKSGLQSERGCAEKGETTDKALREYQSKLH